MTQLADRTPSPVIPTCREDVVRASVYFIEHTDLRTGALKFDYDDNKSADENAGRLLKLIWT